MKRLFVRLIVTGLMAVAWAGSAAPARPLLYERSMVGLDVTRKQFDFLQPWSSRTEKTVKAGVVIGPRQILTTADGLEDFTLIRIQKGGRGSWWNGQIQWIDYHANLAVLTAADPRLWLGLQPLALADAVPTKGPVQIVRWRDGYLESRQGEINRLTVKRGHLTFIDLLQMEVNSEIANVGWGEGLVSGRRLVGLICTQDGNNCTAIPASFIRSVLEARKKTPCRSLGFFDFIWQKVENPATLAFLKLPGEPRGVLVVGYLSQPKSDNVLKPRDILLQIDGFDIDTEGDYNDPAYGKLSIENLATRQKWAGDIVRLKIWRDGKPAEVSYVLPTAEYAVELVPAETFDQDPEYMILGGLLFQPLTEPYLRSWGADWRRKAPFLLAYRTQEKPTPERHALICLSQVLPDPFNLGYQDYRFLTVDKVNGQPISYLTDLAAALQKPVDGFHIIEFRPEESPRRLILDARETEAATQRVLQRYGIARDRVAAPAVKP